MDYSTSMYYTFSTIAQVLAAFLALSGVFVIFKIQELKKLHLYYANKFFTRFGEILNASKYTKVSTIYEHYQELKSVIESENMRNISIIIDEIHHRGDLHTKKLVDHDMQIWSINSILVNKARDRVLWYSKISIISGTLTIMISLITLSTVHWVKSYPSFSIHLFIISLVGSFISILLMIICIFQSLNEKLLYVTNYRLFFIKLSSKISYILQAILVLVMTYPTRWNYEWQRIRERYNEKFHKPTI